MDGETIAEAGKQSQYFRTVEFSALMLDCGRMLKEMVNAPEDAKTVFLTASGSGAMEAAVINLFSVKDKLLIINGGSFGKRFTQICALHDIPFVSIDVAWNEAFNPAKLDPFANAGFTGMLVNMCETSTGQLFPMRIISDFCARGNICLVVDAISSFLCDPFDMKTLNIGAVIVSSQKGFALQPGMSFVVIANDTFEERCKANAPKSLYFRFVDYEADMRRGQTPYTPAVGIINQLYEKSLRLIRSGGAASNISAIKALAVYFREQLSKKTGFDVPPIPLSNCLTPLICKNNNAKEIFETLKNQYAIYVTPCAGELAPFLLRVTHMSRQLKNSDIDQLIGILAKM
jgi:aspartate aminotransferase-like enzyme